MYVGILYGAVYLFQIPNGNIPNGKNFIINILSLLLIVFAVLFILHEILGIRVVESLFDVLDKMFYGFKKEEEEAGQTQVQCQEEKKDDLVSNDNQAEASSVSEYESSDHYN